MTVPGSIWSCALLLCAASVLPAPGNVVRANPDFALSQTKAGDQIDGREGYQSILLTPQL